jgi:hypothetical protein
MSNNTRLAELMNYITIDTTSGNQFQMSGSIKQTSVTSALLKANATGVLTAATAGTDYLTSVGISNLTATGTPSSTTYLRGDNTWATVSGGASSVSTLTDVVITSVANGDVLQYNSSTSKWVNAVVSAGSGVTLNTAQTITAQKTFYADSTASNETPTFGANLLSSAGWATGITGWTGDYTNGWTVVGAGSGTMTNSLAAIASNFYVITFTVTTSVANKYLSGSFGGSSIFTSFSSTGTQTVSTSIYTSSTASLSISATGFDGTISAITIKQRNSLRNPTLIIASSTGANPLEIRTDNIATSYNIFMGIYAGRAIYTGKDNLGIGSQTFGALQSGNSNVALGNQAMAYNVTGSSNIAIGVSTLTSLTNSDFNVAIGYSSMSSTKASGNTSIGHASGQNILSGTSNVAVGQYALSAASSSSATGNVGIGYSTLYNVTNNFYNVAIGYSGLEKITSGDYNIGIGYRAGYYISGGVTTATTINNSIFIGRETFPLANSQTNQIVIGYQTTGLGSNTTVIGNASTTDTAIYGNLLLGNTTTGAAYKLNVTGQSIFKGTSTNETPITTNNVTTGWATGIAGWTGSYPTWDVVGAGSGTMTNSAAATIGFYYIITITATISSSGQSLNMYYGGSFYSFYFSPIGTTTLRLGAFAINTTGLVIAPTTFTGSISAFSVGTRTNRIDPILTIHNSTGAGNHPIEIRSDLPTGATNSSNISIGYLAGSKNLNGDQNVSLGHQAFSSAQTASTCVSIGYVSQRDNVIGSNNTAIGSYTLFQNIVGGSNTAVGANAGYFHKGQYSTYIGAAAGYYSHTGDFNTGIGLYSLQGNSTSGTATGSYNSGLGAYTLGYFTTGSSNTASGYSALYNLSTGSFNVSIGANSLISLITTSNNTALGYNAGRYISGGSVNNTASSNSIFIGYNAYPLADSQTNQIVIGHTAVGLGSNTTVIGNSSTTDTAIYGNLLLGGTTTGAGYKLDVNGTGRFSGSLYMKSPAGVGTFISFTNDSNTTGFDIGHLNGAGAGAYIYQRANQPLIFGTNNANVLTLTGSGAATFSSSVTATQFALSALNTAPATATSTGTLGEVRIDASFIYVCTATNTWKRAAISTW